MSNGKQLLNKVEICSVVSMKLMDKLYEDHSYYDEDDKCFKFKEEYQGIFNEFYDLTWEFIENKSKDIKI